MKNSKQPAFPHATDDPNLNGLTKREYFAAMAMQGILASTDTNIIALNDPQKAWYSVIMADELLKELEK